jgi:hypothetical protein
MGGRVTAGEVFDTVGTPLKKSSYEINCDAV